MNSLSETQAYYPERFLGFSAPPPPFISQPPQRYLKEITTDLSTSRRPIFNEILPSINDEGTSLKPILPNELSTSGKIFDAFSIEYQKHFFCSF